MSETPCWGSSGRNTRVCFFSTCCLHTRLNHKKQTTGVYHTRRRRELLGEGQWPRHPLRFAPAHEKKRSGDGHDRAARRRKVRRGRERLQGVGGPARRRRFGEGLRVASTRTGCRRFYRHFAVLAWRRMCNIARHGRVVFRFDYAMFFCHRYQVYCLVGTRFTFS